MNLKAKLVELNACHSGVAWVADRTLEQAWAECGRGDWMGWLTRKAGLDSRKAAADMAERVWHLVSPDAQLACAWAIDCARRGADDEEMQAARYAAEAAVYASAAYTATAYAAEAAAYAAEASASAAEAAADAAAAVYAAADAAAAVYAAYAAEAAEAAYAARKTEHAAQADIMRSHFTWQDVAKALE